MGKPVTSSSSAKQTKQDRRRDRREEQRRREEEQRRATKRNRVVLGVSVLVVVLVVAASVYFFANKTSDSTSATTTAQSSNAAYPQVDNIVCEANEQVAYHVHAHLSLFIDGQPVPIPQNMGIASDQSCLYWLHTHDTSGVIHVEAPNKQTFVLGTFFKEWNQVFSQQQPYPVQLASTDGWKVYVNGKPYNGDFHKIELSAHTLITMAYQSPKAPIDSVYNWGDL